VGKSRTGEMWAWFQT